MKTLCVLAVLLAVAYASDEEKSPYGYGHAGYAHGGYAHGGYGHGGYGHGHGNGLGHGHGNGYGHGYGYGVYPDQHNAKRQAYVNKIAEKAGTGTGTADEDGVPGTFLDKNHATHGYPGVAGAAHVHANYNRGYGYGYGHGLGHHAGHAAAY